MECDAPLGYHLLSLTDDRFIGKFDALNGGYYLQPRLVSLFPMRRLSP
jgi:hypothetical protein